MGVKDNIGAKFYFDEKYQVYNYCSYTDVIGAVQLSQLDPLMCKFVGANGVSAHARCACEGGHSGHLALFFLLFLSFHVLPNLRAAKGPERSGGTQPSCFIRITLA